MARIPDKPGTYRIRPIDGRYRVSGVKLDGTRLKSFFGSEFEAQAFADTTWGKIELDDWGVPLPAGMKVTPAAVAGMHASLGITPDLPTGPKVETPEEKEKAAKRQKQTNSLMEMVGMGYAMGVCMGSTKLVENAGKDPVKPNPKQVNSLADSTKDTLVDWFGDRNIKPWQMTILLTIAIPVAMLIQSPPKKTDAQKEPNLKSVP